MYDPSMDHEFLNEDEFEAAASEFIRRWGWVQEPNDKKVLEVLIDVAPKAGKDPLAVTVMNLMTKINEKRLTHALKHVDYMSSVEIPQIIDSRFEAQSRLAEAEQQLAHQEAILRQQHHYIMQLQAQLHEVSIGSPHPTYMQGHPPPPPYLHHVQLRATQPMPSLSPTHQLNTID